MIRQSILVVTPLQKEHDNLHQNLAALGLGSQKGRIGKLDAFYVNQKIVIQNIAFLLDRWLNSQV